MRLDDAFEGIDDEASTGRNAVAGLTLDVSALDTVPDVGGRVFDTLGPATDPEAPVDADVIACPRGTAYVGTVDVRGRGLPTLQEFLRGEVDFIAVGVDKKLFRSGLVRYGEPLRIPELEDVYGFPLEFRVVDAPRALDGCGVEWAGVCVDDSIAAHHPVLHARWTLLRA